VGVAATAVARSSLITVPGGCYLDGVSYCAMAAGHAGYSPFSRRVLVPWLVGLLHFGSVIDRFRIVDGVAVLGIAAIVAVLVLAVARELGATRNATWWMAGGAGAISVATPFAVRYVVFNPAYTDAVALAFGTAALATITWRPAGARVWVKRCAAAIFTALAVLSREAWLLPLVGATIVFGDGEPGVAWTRRLEAMAPVAVVGAGAFLIDLLHPYAGPRYDQLAESATLLERYLLHAGGTAALAWSLLFAVGLLPIWLVLSAPRLRRLRQAPVSLAVAAAALIHMVQAALGGGEISRVAWPAGICMLVLAAGWTATAPRRAIGPALVALVGSLVIWRPWVVIHSTADYVGYFTPEHTHGVLRHRVEVDLPIAVAFSVIAVLAARRRPGRTMTSSNRFQGSRGSVNPGDAPASFERQDALG
jgi:hypothetical protein